MKRQKWLRKGLAMFLTAVMVVGMMSGAGTMKALAATESGNGGVTFEPTIGTTGASESENYDKLIDGLSSSSDGTKWCVTNFSSAYIIFSASDPIYINGYSIVTGNDNSSNSGRNPKKWKLYGCNDEAANSASGRNSESWVLIDSVENDTVLKDVNYTKYDYPLANPTEENFQYFKLEIEKIQNGQVMQMGEFSLSYSTCEHNWVITDETIPPTCTEGGCNVYQCTKCTRKKKVANGTPANNHTWGGDTVVEPTCQKGGYTLQTCSVCGEEQKINLVDPSNHNYIDGLCRACGTVKPESQPAQDEKGVYQISKASELYWFAGLVNGTLSDVTQNKGAKAALTADITINENVLNNDGTLNTNASLLSWEPIGNSSFRYTGTFDGQNHTISGLYCSAASTEHVGFFGNVGSYGKISNVGIVDSYFCGYNYVGGVCGLIFGATIENCYNSGTVTGDQGVGGVCGNNNTDGTIKNCYNNGKVSGDISIGGVCGVNYKTITNCYNDTSCCKKAVGRSSGTVTNVEGKTTAQFRRGEVCYLLNEGITDGSQKWYQNIDNGAVADSCPTFEASHGTVYQATNCIGIYSNTPNIRAEHSYILNPEDKTKHICENCLETEVHALADLKYSADDDGNIITVTCGKCEKIIGTVTLYAPVTSSESGSGTSEATVVNTVQCEGFTAPDIIYKKSDGTNLGTVAPTEMGAYTASITLGTGTGAATVSVIFSLGKALPNIGSVRGDSLYNTLDITEVKLSRSDSTVSGTLSLKEGTTLQYGTHDYTYVFTPTGDDANDYTQIEGKVSITVYDTVAPESVEVQVKTKKWQTFSNNTTCGIFFKNAQRIVVRASDAVAGIDSIQYLVSDSPMQKTELAALSNESWNNYGYIHYLTKGKHYVYIKATDKAGNTTYVGTDCIVIYEDTTAESTDVTYNYNENTDKTVSLTLNGNTIEAITDMSGVTLVPGTDYTVDANGTITFKAAYLAALSVSETAYSFTVSYKPQGETYVKNTDEQGIDLNDVPTTTTIQISVKEADGSVTDISDLSKTYDGKAVSSPTFTSTNDTSESNVTVEYKKVSDENSVYVTTAPKDVGEYKVRVTVAADENFGIAIGEKTFTISPKNIEGATISLGDSLTYNGGEQNQKVGSVTVGTGENLLTLTASDYEVTGATQINAGNYTLTVNGRGNFIGSATKDFTIAKAAAPVITAEYRNYCYTIGSAGNTITINIADLLPGDRGNTTYVLEENDATYVINKAVSNDGKLTYKVDTQETFGASTTLTVTATSNNYEDIRVDVIIRLIDKNRPSEREDAKVAIVGRNELTYGQKLSTLRLNKDMAVFVEEDDVTEIIAGRLDWTNPDAVLEAGTTEAEWTFTPFNSALYNTLTGKLAITVKKEKPNVTVLPTVAEQTYHPTAKLSDISLTGASVLDVNGNELSGTWNWKTAEVIPTVENDGYDAVFTPVDTENYEIITKTIEVNVAKATPFIKEAPTASTISYGDTIEKATLTGGSVQYSSTDDTAVAGTFAWKEDTTKPDNTTTTYTVVFTPENKNYNIVEKEITITRLPCTHATTEIRDAVAATTTAKGYTGDTFCKDCGAKLAEGKEIDIIPVNDVNAVNDAKDVNAVNDAKDVDDVNVDTARKLLKKGDVVVDDKKVSKVTVTNVIKKEVEYKEPAKKKAKTITIPATVKIDGVTYKVTRIANNACKNNKSVTKITIGSNIKSIGKNIFKGCKKLKTIKITSTKLTSKSISKDAFKGLTKATTIKVPKKKLTAYKKLFKKKGFKGKVKA